MLQRLTPLLVVDDFKGSQRGIQTAPPAPVERWTAGFRVTLRVVLSIVTRKVIKCSVCGRFHNLTELINPKHLPNGTTTFTCPVKILEGRYSLENVGTINPNVAA